jgi:hypothetical protein
MKLPSIKECKSESNNFDLKSEEGLENFIVFCQTRKINQYENLHLKIIGIIKEKLGFDIREKSRKREFVYARAVFYNELNKLGIFTLQWMGDFLNQDHSTVIHTLKE